MYILHASYTDCHEGSFVYCFYTFWFNWPKVGEPPPIWGHVSWCLWIVYCDSASNIFINHSWQSFPDCIWWEGIVFMCLTDVHLLILALIAELFLLQFLRAFGSDMPFFATIPAFYVWVSQIPRGVSECRLGSNWFSNSCRKSVDFRSEVWTPRWM